MSHAYMTGKVEQHMPDMTELGAMNLGKTVSRTSLVEETLREAILSGQLASGQQLVERNLAQVLGTSKTPIREALISLSRRGLVESSNYHGMTVRRVTPTMVRNVQEVRVLLETEVIVKGLGHIAEAALERAEEALRRSSAAADREQWDKVAAANRDFHQALYAQNPNEIATSFLDQLQDQVALIARVSWSQNSDPRAEADEHEQILAAVRAQDPTAVRNLLAKHFDHLMRFADELDKGERI